ncbi:hypothetical protein F5882DRAFT_156237 [Hyaloscypha sp. PMI_1271]|nr:hypothetical protein F5882DRAFT_156237 [Hyaloscypha sp. PMI_1271]
MPRSKGKKTDIPPPLVGQKRHRKPTAKALPPPPPPPPPPKPPKIKLTTAPRPLPELSPDTSPTRASPEKEVFIEIPSSSSEESPEPEKKTHMVTVNWQVYLNHKLVHAEAFQEDFLCSLHHPYRHWKSWIHMKAEDTAKTDKEVKARKKWKALYGPISNRLIFHIEDRESFERFEHMMVSRGSRGVDCALEARFVTKGDPESSPILDRTSGKRRKIPDPPKLVYSDDDSDAKKSVPPIKKPRKSATTIAVESLVKERKD